MLLGIATPAQPCGDKLVALGGGVGFDRVVASRHPGRIALLLEPASALAQANERFNLASALSLAGHDVAVAADRAGLEAALAAAPTDLVLVDAALAGNLHPTQAPAGRGTVILPVVFAASPSETVALEQQLGCVTDAGDRDGRRLLRTVEKVLKLRHRGQPLPCEGQSGLQRA
jgi:hypothetical protein